MGVKIIRTPVISRFLDSRYQGIDESYGRRAFVNSYLVGANSSEGICLLKYESDHLTELQSDRHRGRAGEYANC